MQWLHFKGYAGAIACTIPFIQTDGKQRKMTHDMYAQAIAAKHDMYIRRQSLLTFSQAIYSGDYRDKSLASAK